MTPMPGRGDKADHDHQANLTDGCARQLGLEDKFAAAAHSHGTERGLLVKSPGIKIVGRDQQTDPATMRNTAEAG